MARWGNCDFRQLQKMQQKMHKIQGVDLDFFCKECAKELAARLLRKVIKDTPIGDYPSSTGKVGGTLVKGWTGDKTMAAKSYISSLPITKIGTDYQIEIINPIEYASYVEFGHRSANHKRWIKGRFMLTKSEMELEAQMDKIIEKKLMKFLGEYLNGE